MEGYLNDPAEQDGPDDAPFPGGSTEMKDAWLGEQLGQTRVGSTPFRVAYAVAMARLHEPLPGVTLDAEAEHAVLTQAMGALPYASLNILRGHLLGELRYVVDRALTEDEVARVDAFARAAWDLRHGARVA